MLKFWYNNAPNPMKVALMLEELGVPKEKVHFELFFVDEPPPALRHADRVVEGVTSDVTVVPLPVDPGPSPETASAEGTVGGLLSGDDGPPPVAAAVAGRPAGTSWCFTGHGSHCNRRASLILWKLRASSRSRRSASGSGCTTTLSSPGCSRVPLTARLSCCHRRPGIASRCETVAPATACTLWGRPAAGG